MRPIVRLGLTVTATTLLLAGVAAPALAPVATAAARTTAAAPVANELVAVSCSSSGHCLAVGVNHDAFGGTGGPLAEIWNGKKWGAVAVRLPAGATAGALNGVDCLSARDCVAVGSYFKGAVDPYQSQFALVDTWNGKTWKPVTASSPGGRDASLDAVSCVSATRCVASGGYTNDGQQDVGFAEIWNGRTWTATEPPVPESNYAALDAVSCTAATSCIAVGWVMAGTLTYTLIDSWNGRSWSQMAAALPQSFATLAGVSCTARDRCAAVGPAYNLETGIQGSTVQLWNGKTWSSRTVTWPTGTTSPTLTAVACATANRCAAVGTIDPRNGSNTGRAAAVTWNGKAWTAVSIPSPRAGEASVFNAVTCLTASDCVAVGQAGPTGTTNGSGLSGFWNGKRWRLVTAN